MGMQKVRLTHVDFPFFLDLVPKLCLVALAVPISLKTITSGIQFQNMNFFGGGDTDIQSVAFVVFKVSTYGEKH